MGLLDRLKDRIEAIPKAVWTPRPEVLLCANTVKPMHGVVPRVILGSTWWDKTRKAAYASTDYHCIACATHKVHTSNKWLEGHELYKIDYKRGIQTYVETVPLCHYCHNFIHDGRLRVLLDNQVITQDKYDAIMEHGAAVLKDAKLKKKHYTGPIAEWSKWRLVLDGKEYPPIFKDYDDWYRHFNVESDV